jgi:hypothetical protein
MMTPTPTGCNEPNVALEYVDRQVDRSAGAGPDLERGRKHRLEARSPRRNERGRGSPTHRRPGPIAFGHDPDASLLAPALELAIATDRTVHDCMYLALAIDRKCRVVTADERFVDALSSTPFSKHIRHVTKLR